MKAEIMMKCNNPQCSKIRAVYVSCKVNKWGKVSEGKT